MKYSGHDTLKTRRQLSAGGKTYDYPMLKLMINRLANTIVQVALGLRYNDATNAFKLYRKETITGLNAPHSFRQKIKKLELNGGQRKPFSPKTGFATIPIQEKFV